MKYISMVLVLYVILAAGCTSPPAPQAVTEPEVSEPVFHGEYVDVKDASRPPVLIKPANPGYPSDLRRAGIEGYVHLAYIVGKDGIPQQVQVLGATHPGFGPPAAAAVAKWRFRAGSKDGAPVAVAVMQILSFNLSDEH